MLKEDVNDQFLVELVKSYIEKLPKAKKEKLWDDLLTKIILEEVHHWELEKIVTDEVKKHAAVYLQRPEIQEKLRKKAREVIDKLCKGTFDILFQRLNHLENEVIAIHTPSMERQILAIIKEQPDIQTRELMNHAPNKRFQRRAYYNAFDNLQSNGRIVAVSHGKGKNRTWRINEKGG